MDASKCAGKDGVPAQSFVLQLPALFGDRALQLQKSSATEMHKYNASDCSTEISFRLQGGETLT